MEKNIILLNKHRTFSNKTETKETEQLSQHSQSW